MEGFPPELETLLRQVMAFLPQLVRAIVLLIVGALLGLLLETVGATMLRSLGFDGFADRAGVTRVLRDASRDKDQKASTLAGTLIFWIVMLTFMGVAAEVLGLSAFGKMMTALAAFLPRLLGAALLLVLGLFLGQAARELIAAPADREVTPSGWRQLDRGVQVVIVALTVIAALSLVGIDLRWVTWLVVVLVAVAGLAVALAFGVGFQGLVRDLAAGFYLRAQLKAGQRLRVGEVEGELLQLTPLHLVLQTAEGRLALPYSLVHSRGFVQTEPADTFLSP
ncbi:MAG TPA: mechanosensitive ion channel [Anaerolineae bacterium]|nr:mechanosensitive ion channel [Anaerolineae bacterium]